MTNNPSSGDDEINAFAIDVSGGAMYLVGSDVTPGNNEWRIEKRNLSNGSLVYATTTNPSSGNDFAAAVALNTASGTMYIAGRDTAPGDAQWRIESRNLSDGSLVYATTSNPSGNIDIPGGIAVDTASGVMYAAGRTDAGWRVEKRLLSSGAFVTAFGTDGVLTSDPSANVDGANAVVLGAGGGDIYAGGFDAVFGASDRQWRLERRDTADGSSPWGAVLAARDTPATSPPRNTPFRLRTLLHVDNGALGQATQDFKLQFAPRSGTCDTGFSGETYQDVSATSSIQYAQNPGPPNGTSLYPKNSDPDHGTDILVDETYQESNSFTNSVAVVPIGQDGKWDFALVASGTPAGTSYCFRVVKSDSSLLNTYNVIPEITTRATLSASADNTFEFEQATTSVPTLTIVAASSTGGAITATNDIRIRIASSSVSMRWNTASSALILGGTAASKVSSTALFPDAFTLLLGVNTNFAEGDTLTVDGLSVSNFSAANAAASPFELYVDGDSDTEADDVSDKKVTIRGKFTLADTPGGGKTNKFDIGGTSLAAAELLEFRLVPTGEQATTSQVVIELYDIVGLSSSDITNAEFRVDANANGTIDAGETQAVGGAGTVSAIAGGSGTITFSTPFVTTSTLNLILRADLSSLDDQDVLKARVGPQNITASGKKSQVLLVPAGSTSPVLHAKPFRARGGGAGAEGGAPPSGGSAGGGDATSAGPNNPAASANDAGVGTIAWTNVGNALASDDARSSAALPALNASNYLKVTGFSFSIPDTAMVNGIVVEAEKRQSGLTGNIRDNAVRIVKGGVIGSADRSSASDWPTSDSYSSYGSASDLWGAGWAPSDINSSNFGVAISAQETSGLVSRTAEVDHVRVTVYYTPVGAGGGCPEGGCPGGGGSGGGGSGGGGGGAP